MAAPKLYEGAASRPTAVFLEARPVLQRFDAKLESAGRRSPQIRPLDSFRETVEQGNQLWGSPARRARTDRAESGGAGSAPGFGKSRPHTPLRPPWTCPRARVVTSVCERLAACQATTVRATFSSTQRSSSFTERPAVSRVDPAFRAGVQSSHAAKPQVEVEGMA